MRTTNLGIALEKSPGPSPAAVTENRAALRLDPGFAKAYANLGIAWARNAGGQEAVAELKTAVELQSDSAEARCNLANGFGALRRPRSRGDCRV